jgi:hypothetical protein
MEELNKYKTIEEDQSNYRSIITQTKEEELISSRYITSNNNNSKKDNNNTYNLSKNDHNTTGDTSKNIYPSKHKIILKSDSSKKRNVKISAPNTSYSNFINKSQDHIITNSKNKPKIPNLIRNIHYRNDIKKKDNDIFRFQPQTSFEQKLSKELLRLNNKYTIVKNRKFFNKMNNTNLYWANFLDYGNYKQLKELETRVELPNAFGRHKLRPLIYQPKDSLGKLAQNLYKADQENRIKKYFYNKYKIKNNQIIQINEENNEL